MAKTDRKLELQKTKELIVQVMQPHRRINPCFMTGKGCVYTEHIDREIENRHKLADDVRRKIEDCLKVGADITEENLPNSNNMPRPLSGFTIIPFKPNFITFYQLCLSRYVTGDYFQQISLEKADSVRKTGYVICEKICKKIQESDFVIADISVPNPNVFYELGLAYGSEQKIFLIANRGSEFAKAVKVYCADTPLLEYDNLNILSQNNFDLTGKYWKFEKQEIPLECKTLLLIDDSSVVKAIPIKDSKKREKSTSKVDEDNTNEAVTRSQRDGNTVQEDIEIDFITHVKAALGVAIVNIEDIVSKNSGSDLLIPEIYREWISKLKGDEKESDNEGIKLALDTNRFRDVLTQVNKAFCVLIKTGKGCHPMMYFWLGYCHARGKNVIPITEINIRPDKNEADETFSDLAFDIRALWHIIFDAKSPDNLEKALEESLYQMILNDYSEWSRKRFWDEILEKRGKVSIFTGALHNQEIGREMIGDWDLRAVSELTSYFASHQYRASIESPVYHYPALENKMSMEEYVRSLKRMLRDKNCVIIASPDVNPLTEIVLCQVYGLKPENWFDGKYDAAQENNSAVVAFKEVKRQLSALNDEQTPTTSNKVKLTFYREDPPRGNESEDDEKEKKKLKRGFKTRFFKGLKDFRLEGDFIDQMREEGEFNVHAHLAVVPNPFSSPSARKFIVLLNGVSGPATFALTHVLTGGVSEEFVSYRSAQLSSPEESSSTKSFDPKSESEKILKSLLTEFISSQKEKSNRGVQCIISVGVGPAKNKPASPFDWRHILKWELAKNEITNEVIDIGSFEITYEK
jgi:nucleoside 2-deoxyribosyltransferase